MERDGRGKVQEASANGELEVQDIRTIDTCQGLLFPDFERVGEAISFLKRIADEANSSILTPELLRAIEEPVIEYWSSFSRGLEIKSREHDALIHVQSYQRHVGEDLIERIRKETDKSGQFLMYPIDIYSRHAEIPSQDLFPYLRVDRLRNIGYVMTVEDWDTHRSYSSGTIFDTPKPAKDTEKKLAETLAAERLLLERKVEIDFKSEGDRASINFDEILARLRPLIGTLEPASTFEKIKRFKKPIRGREVAAYLGSTRHILISSEGYSLGAIDGIEVMLDLKEDPDHIEPHHYQDALNWDVEGPVISGINTAETPLGIVVKFASSRKNKGFRIPVLSQAKKDRISALAEETIGLFAS